MFLRFHKSRLVFVVLCIVRAKNHLRHIKGCNHMLFIHIGVYMYTIKKSLNLQFIVRFIALKTFSGIENNSYLIFSFLCSRMLMHGLC
jgi:hypothetical protein